MSHLETIKSRTTRALELILSTKRNLINMQNFCVICPTSMLGINLKEARRLLDCMCKELSSWRIHRDILGCVNVFLLPTLRDAQMLLSILVTVRSSRVEFQIQYLTLMEMSQKVEELVAILKELQTLCLMELRFMKYSFRTLHPRSCTLPKLKRSEAILTKRDMIISLFGSYGGLQAPAKPDWLEITSEEDSL